MDPFEAGFGLTLPRATRTALWARTGERLEAYLAALPGLPVSPGDVHADLAAFDFQTPMDPLAVVDAAADMLQAFNLNTAHPAYFGVFNPAAATMGIAADALVAAFNPQLASSASARACIAIEDHLLAYFGAKFGYDLVRGSFQSGGTTANYTALQCALTAHVPGYGTEGVGPARPVLYTSTETHHSILRAARMSGLGTSAVVALPVGPDLRFDVAALRARIHADRNQGKHPLFLVATLGSTSSGTFDDVAALAEVAQTEGMWLHADAAWGGAAILLEECAPLFEGIRLADSITLDAHKWLSVPMGAGMFLTRHPDVQEATFRVDQSPYMPGHTYESAETEPYKQSIEWSRRFIGLKLFMALAAHGEAGYQAVLRHQIAMGAYMRERLAATGWELVNDSPLPVVCFWAPGLDPEAVARQVADSGKSWITPTKLNGRGVLRAGIPNFATQREHVDVLIDVLQGCKPGTPAP
ncbi:MAG: Aromatic-L-amino-acid decarboxylase [Cyanobacteria bacterium RYN_339]|nr:Aromatic-L-amino-acid decarboxylase [Cyanobacteria bacterium RYN_339]